MKSLHGKILANTFFSSAGNLTVKIFAAIGYVLILRKLAVHDYGVFVLLVSLVGPASTIILFSFDRIFVSFFSEARGKLDYARMKGIFRDYYMISISLMIISMVAAYIFRGLLAEHYSFYLLEFFWPTCFFIISQLVMNLVSLFLEANERFKQISILETLESVSRVCFVIIAFVSLPFSVTTVLWIYTAAKLVASAVGAFFFVSVYRKAFPVPIVAQKGIVLEILKSFGKWEIGRSLLSQIGQPIRLFAIKLFVNVEAVAVYDFARNVYSVCSSAFPLGSVIFPFISSNIHKKDILHLIVLKAQKYSYVFSAVMFVAVFVASPMVIKYVFPQYIGGIFIVYLMVLHMFIDAYKVAQDGLIYAFREQKFIFYTLPIFVILQTFLDIICTKFFGVAGSAIAWHIGPLISAIVIGAYIAKKWGIPRVRIAEIFRFDAYDKLILGKAFGRIRRFLPSSTLS